MYLSISENLSNGRSVISDISNLERINRDKLREIANDNSSLSRVIYVRTPTKIARERWLENKITKTRFDITEKIFTEAILTLEEPTEDEDVMIFDINENTDEWIEENIIE